MENEHNILDLIRILTRWRRMIATSFLSVVVITAIISLFLPKAYRATAIVYPPQDAQNGSGLSALLGDLQGSLLGGLGGGSASATEFVPVVESERVRLAVAGRFHLAEQYQSAHQSDLLGQIQDKLNVELSREQFLSISYEAETAQKAADITNAFVEELEKALQDRNRDQLQTYRAYLETRLKQAESDMLQAELQYNHFQKDNMAIDIEAQAKAQIESASNSISLLVDKIIERDIKAELLSPDHPELRKLDLEIKATTRALDNLLMGKMDLPVGENPHPLPGIFKPFNEIPQLGLMALQLLRNVEIQSVIFQFVKKEYEKTRFEEEKETTTVVVLDSARPPDSRSKPARTMMVAIAGGLSLVLSSLLAFIFEAIGNLTPENRAKLDAIKKDIQKKK
jgi:tyrosine-protein kinase Etk/Wzc